MWLLSLIVIPVSFLMLYFGYQIKVKQRISLVHDYHWRNVKEEDIKAYTSLMGVGQFAMGFACLFTGMLGFFFTSIMIILPLFIGMAIGFLLMHKAQKKYNGSWFS